MKRFTVLLIALALLDMAAVLLLVARGGVSGVSDIVRPLLADARRQQSAFQFPRANIIVIGLDAVRPDDTSMFGHPSTPTPNLARFAQESFSFKRAFAVTSWTLPSFMSIFTGLYPSVSGVTNKWTVVSAERMVETRLSPTVTTLPQLLKRSGYALAAFTGDAGVSAKYGFGNDFDAFVDDVRFGGLDHSIPKALAWLRERPTDRPFFLFLHGYDAHGQYDPPSGYTRRYVSDYRGPLKGGRDEQEKMREAGLQTALAPATLGEPRIFDMTEADATFYRQLYDEKIADADERVGQFLSQLKQMGLYESSIIVIVSDHGDEFLEHGTIDHGQSLYDELTHVLFMMRFPGQTSGRVIDDKVCLIDVLPTVLDAVGVALPQSLNGLSLLPLLRGEKLAQRDKVYAETDYRLFVHKRAVRSDRYKFIMNLVTQKRELYDLSDDPGEHRNIASSNSRVAYEMEQDLLRWLRSMNTQVDSFQGRKEDFIKEF